MRLRWRSEIPKDIACLIDDIGVLDCDTPISCKALVTVLQPKHISWDIRDTVRFMMNSMTWKESVQRKHHGLCLSAKYSKRMRCNWELKCFRTNGRSASLTQD